MKKLWPLKLIGLVILTMISLMLLSFLEVAIYSYFINPGHEEALYDAHAQASAPYISGIFGFIIFFLTARYWKKRNYPNALQLTIAFPVLYFFFDIVILIAAGVNWSDFFLIFVISNLSKFLGSYFGYRLTE